MTTAVIYARFSCSKQREASIDDQLRECRSYCKRNSIEVVHEYCDYAMSGKTDDRPEFQRMIANAGESDIVLVYMMDRFSRDPYDAPIYKQKLSKHGVRVVSALEYVDASPEGVIMEKLLEGLAARESMVTSIRTKRGMHGNALQAKVNGNRIYGYRTGADGRYEIDPFEAEIVKEIFARRLAGESVGAIQTDLRDRGVKSARGNRASYGMVQSILKNRKYTGEYRFGDVVIPDGMPRIVSDHDFDQVQHTRASVDRATQEWTKYALVGRAQCSVCGHDLAGMSAYGRHGKRYTYYTCNSRCQKSVRQDWLEPTLAAAIRDALKDRDTVDRIAAEVCAERDGSSTSVRVESAKARIKEAESALAGILKSIEAGVVFPGINERIEQLTTQKNAAEEELAVLSTTVRIDPEEFAAFLLGGANLSNADLLDVMVYQVVVSDTDVVAIMNWDTDKKEPARLKVERVREISEWLPISIQTRTAFAVVDGSVAIRVQRQAA